ncbi:MAG: antiterminator LoaP [Firmicutes bacterium]|nr:antiterminator LoaP [Bacillota bacterium]
MYYFEGMGKWYALFVMTGEEEKVKERLLYRFRERDDLRIIVPMRRIRERKDGRWEVKLKTLFPGYVLYNGIMGIEEYYNMKGVPGLLRVLKNKYEPLEIDEEEIYVISRLMCNGEIIGTSTLYESGEKIVVVDGPLVGLEGLIESVDTRKGRAKVRLNFIGESRLVDLSIKMIHTA